MERYRKKDMLRAVDTLLNANDAIVKTARSNPQGVAEALVQCQESAIALGTYIDTLDVKYEYLVHMLEDYCENIYQMSESLSDENKCRKISKKIRKQLIELQDGIKYDLPEDKKEIVFLPYKASMWDSLESVWKAADADPGCDAYVIPIPYFDKNPDGSFREEHYEGDQYPENVPITRYDEYDLEERHPDVIYIHNPYDECNHVTSVHPYFYCKNLRNYTDKLVYIPYFVLEEIEPHNQSAVDDMKHFCFLPGTIYADQVIVQSENMRQIYINEYIKAAKEMGLGGEHVDRKFLEKKFLGTGSPKFEKILNTRKEDLEIPAEWLKIIEKPDGSWKKIIFYNISVSALLHDEEKLLRKMESVFELFKENQDKVALLWRPHPLIQSTIESMRPQLWEAYKEIRDKYIEEGWGIYDDSADVDRAIVLSDAYYGVGSSSVVHLCKKAGMPVMVQNVDIIDYDLNVLEDKLEDYIIADKKICWFNGETIVLQERNDKNRDSYKWINTGEIIAACEVDGEIYFAPMERNKIQILDIYKAKMHYMELPKDRYANLYNKFYQAKACGNEIYFLPGKYPYILELNLRVNKMERYNLDLEELGVNTGELLFYESSYIYDGRIYLASANNGNICIFDIKSKQILYKRISDNDGFTTVCGYGNEIYLADKKGDVYKLLIEGSKWQYGKISDNKNVKFRKSIYWYDKVFMFAEETEECVLIEPNSNSVKIVSLSKINNKKYNGNKYGSPKIFDKKLYIVNKLTKTVIVLSNELKVEEYPVNNMQKSNMKFIWDGNEVISENEDDICNTLVFYIKNMESLCK